MTSEPGEQPSLEERLEVLLDSTEGIREQIRLENDASEERFRVNETRLRTNRRAFIAALIAAFLALIVGGLGVKTARDANADRDSARIASCKQYNRQQKVQIEAETIQSHDLVNALARGISDPTRRAQQVALYNKTHDAIIAGGHPRRDCTPEGIRLYLSTPER